MAFDMMGMDKAISAAQEGPGAAFNGASQMGLGDMTKGQGMSMNFDAPQPQMETDAGPDAKAEVAGKDGAIAGQKQGQNPLDNFNFQPGSSISEVVGGGLGKAAIDVAKLGVEVVKAVATGGASLGESAMNLSMDMLKNTGTGEGGGFQMPSPDAGHGMSGGLGQGGNGFSMEQPGSEQNLSTPMQDGRAQFSYMQDSPGITQGGPMEGVQQQAPQAPQMNMPRPPRMGGMG